MKIPYWLPVTLLLLPASLLLGGCSKGQEPMPAPLYLLDQPWQLTAQQGQAVGAGTGAAGPVTLTLGSLGNVSTGRASGTAYRSTFLLVAGTDNLLFAEPTHSARPTSDQYQESRYLALLPQVRRYTISRHHLQLFDSVHAQPVLVFEAE